MRSPAASPPARAGRARHAAREGNLNSQAFHSASRAPGEPACDTSGYTPTANFEAVLRSRQRIRTTTTRWIRACDIITRSDGAFRIRPCGNSMVGRSELGQLCMVAPRREREARAHRRLRMRHQCRPAHRVHRLSGAGDAPIGKARNHNRPTHRAREHCTNRAPHMRRTNLHRSRCRRLSPERCSSRREVLRTVCFTGYLELEQLVLTADPTFAEPVFGFGCRGVRGTVAAGSDEVRTGACVTAP